MEGELLAELADLRRNEENLCITHRVPTEVWEVVFYVLQPSYSYCGRIPGPTRHYAWISVLLVCRHFYEVAVGCSTLWTRVYICPTTLTIAERFLQRSGQHELFLIVSGFMDEFATTPHSLDLVKSAAHRAHTLVVVDSAMHKIMALEPFPTLNTLICRQTATERSDLPAIEWPELRVASFQPPLTNAVNQLPHLTSLFLGSPQRDPEIRLSSEDISAILATQPLLAELIFVRVLITEEPDRSEMTPHTLQRLRRLALHRCESAAVRTIVQLIRPTSGLAILVDTIAHWKLHVDYRKVFRLIEKLVPEEDQGYTDVFIGGLERRKSPLIQISLTGRGVSYNVILPAGAGTLHRILGRLVSMKHFACVQRMWVLGVAYTAVGHNWFQSASELSTLTIQWPMTLWCKPNWLAKLFQVLPPALRELLIMVYPIKDDERTEVNYNQLFTLNNNRTLPLRIHLKVRNDPARKEQIAKIYDLCKDEQHVSVTSWNFAEMRNALTTEHRRNDCCVMSEKHEYWPSWFDRPSEYCYDHYDFHR